MCWKYSKYQGFEIDIVIRLCGNGDNNMTVLELVVYGNWSTREKMWQG